MGRIKNVNTVNIEVNKWRELAFASTTPKTVSNRINTLLIVTHCYRVVMQAIFQSKRL